MFCGSARAVPARVLPDWLDDCFADCEPVGGERAIACKSCIRAWDGVERRAQALLAPLIAGNPTLLAQQSQELLAFWCTKSVLTLQTVRDPDLLPGGAFRQLRATMQPPTGFRIALALRPREGGWPYRFSASGSASTLRSWDVEPTFGDAALDHYRAELCIGHLVIRAAANFTPHARPYDHGPEAIEIWPLGAPAAWPRGLVRTQRRAA